MKNFDNYEIVRKIGEGAQGEVYLAKDKRLGRNVAIKSLHVDLITNTVLKERFIGEAKLLGQLNHPSIVCLYEYIVDSSGYHLIMEYLKGNPLDDYINKFNGPINEIRAINIFIQVLDAISHIHIKNKLHRDIKPSNIIIDENDKVKLLDFGIAKDLDNNPNLTTVGQNVGGTPMYMSPEHISTEEITLASDIYSLGVTLWQMLTGKAPYEGKSMAKIYSSIENEPLAKIQNFYPYTSKKINDIIQKATNKDPKKRYDSCKSFIRALIDLKDTLIKKDAKSKGDVNLMKNIELRVVNAEDAAFVINSVGCIGTELTYSGLPGEKLNIEIHKKGYDSISKELIINEDELIEFKLKKKMPAFISLILLIVSFFIFNFYKLVILLVNKKILKFNESKTHNLSKNLDKSNASLNHRISSVKLGLLELSTFFGAILIVILISTFSVNNSEVTTGEYPSKVFSTDLELEPAKDDVLKHYMFKVDGEIFPVDPRNLDKFMQDHPDAINVTREEVRARNDSIIQARKDSITKSAPKHEPLRKIKEKVPDPVLTPETSHLTFSEDPETNVTKSDFKKRYEQGNYEFYTNNFTDSYGNGWKLIINTQAKGYLVRAYKNDRKTYEYVIEMNRKLTHVRYNKSDNTLNTNYLGPAGPRKWLIDLNKKAKQKNPNKNPKWSPGRDPYWKSSDINIPLLKTNW